MERIMKKAFSPTLLHAETLASQTEFAAVSLPASFVQTTFLLRSSAASGIIKKGEKVTFTLSGKVPEDIHFFLMEKYVNGMKKLQKIFPKGAFPVITLKGKEPGSLILTIKALSEKQQLIEGYPPVGDGVLVDPDNLLPARKCPEDLEKFWNKELDALAKVPLHVERKILSSPPGMESLHCEDVKIASAGPLPVTGYLVMPEKAKEKSLPAIVCYHGAGYKSSMLQLEMGENAIVLDANAHGLENGRESEYYLQLNKQPNCVMFSRDSLKDSYVKYMFLRTVRALDFVKSLPQWDGKNLIVFGRSQGGSQSLAAAALCKDVSLCVSHVPALGDHAAKTVKRQPGWPVLNGRAGERIRKVSDYVDIVFLASLVRCPTFFSAGLMDLICPPTSIVLARNQMQKGFCKELKLFPCMGHHAPGSMDKKSMIISLCRKANKNRKK